MTSDPAPLPPTEDGIRAIASHFALVAEALPVTAYDVRVGNGWHGGFARDFSTADGERVMVAALTRQQFADLAKTTRLARTFAFLERVLRADFSACGGDLYTHRAAIAALLAPWFSRRTVADLDAAFAGTSVPWHACTTSPAERASDAEVEEDMMTTDRGMRASGQDRERSRGFGAPARGWFDRAVQPGRDVGGHAPRRPGHAASPGKRYGSCRTSHFDGVDGSGRGDAESESLG